LKIAILGSRGIPANYGGFETFSEELSIRLASRGHQITVYCCKPYSTLQDATFRGIRRVVLPTIRTKIFEKPIFALLSLIHVLFKKCDVVLMLGVSVVPFCFIPRIFGKKIAVNIDGLEWQRKKWGKLISRYLKFSERMAGITSNCVITDAICISDYYKKTYKREVVYIPYGAEIVNVKPEQTLQKFGLKPNEYIIYVGRFEPENHALLVREIFDEIEKPSKKFVMVGGAPFAHSYIKKVKDTQNENIIFTGEVYGKEYKELLSNAYCFIQATEIGGTHLALLEAMAAGNNILANDIPEHREVLGDTGIYYSGKEDLKQKMLELLGNGARVKTKNIAVKKLVEEKYSWERVTDEYEKLFEALIKGSGLKI
jgi:glycosyltransferase involved in cell wall biosynthesis